MAKVVDLEQRSQFRILLNPVRQEIIRLLSLAGRPLSVRTVAKELNLSPMAAKSHLEKLAALGVVEAQAEADGTDHTRTLYAMGQVEIRLHLGRKDDLQGEREALAAEFADAVFRGAVDTSRRFQEEELEQSCRFFTGVLHLTRQEREELSALVSDYLSAHRAPAPEAEEHWEYLLLAHRGRSIP